jgi:hypothetical protein
MCLRPSRECSVVTRRWEGSSRTAGDRRITQNIFGAPPAAASRGRSQRCKKCVSRSLRIGRAGAFHIGASVVLAPPQGLALARSGDAYASMREHRDLFRGSRFISSLSRRARRESHRLTTVGSPQLCTRVAARAPRCQREMRRRHSTHEPPDYWLARRLDESCSMVRSYWVSSATVLRHSFCT